VDFDKDGDPLVTGHRGRGSPFFFLAAAPLLLSFEQNGIHRAAVMALAASDADLRVNAGYPLPGEFDGGHGALADADLTGDAAV
jgi:hypothetical protein